MRIVYVCRADRTHPSTAAVDILVRLFFCYIAHTNSTPTFYLILIELNAMTRLKGKDTRVSRQVYIY